MSVDNWKCDPPPEEPAEDLEPSPICGVLLSGGGTAWLALRPAESVSQVGGTWYACTVHGGFAISDDQAMILSEHIDFLKLDESGR